MCECLLCTLIYIFHRPLGIFSSEISNLLTFCLNTPRDISSIWHIEQVSDLFIKYAREVTGGKCQSSPAIASCEISAQRGTLYVTRIETDWNTFFCYVQIKGWISLENPHKVYRGKSMTAPGSGTLAPWYGKQPPSQKKWRKGPCYFVVRKWTQPHYYWTKTLLDMSWRGRCLLFQVQKMWPRFRRCGPSSCIG